MILITVAKIKWYSRVGLSSIASFFAGFCALQLKDLVFTEQTSAFSDPCQIVHSLHQNFLLKIQERAYILQEQFKPIRLIVSCDIYRQKVTIK